MSDNSALRTFLEGIRDERRTSANTAFRIGSAFIELLDLLENLDLDDKYLSKVHDDEAHGFIKFLKGLESTTVTFSEYLKSKGASKGFLDGKGIYMDALEGLIQTDGLEVRGFMRIMELIFNRLQLMESDYSFTEGCEVEHIDYLQDGRLKLTIHKRHDKDYQPFYYGDILYAKVNSLLPRGSAVPDGHTSTKNGSYYTVWVRVNDIDYTDNTITVSLYESIDGSGKAVVPGAHNFTFYGTSIRDHNDDPAATVLYEAGIAASEAMSNDVVLDMPGATLGAGGFDTNITLTRHGNVADGYNPQTGKTDEAVRRSQQGRQQSWLLSTTDQRLSYHWHVDTPIIRSDNVAMCLGILPTMLDDDGILPATRDKSMPSLYINTLFYENEHHIFYPSRIVKVDRGEWKQNPTVVYEGPGGTYTPDGTLLDIQAEVDAGHIPENRAGAAAVVNTWGGTYQTGGTITEPYHFESFTKATWLANRLDTRWAKLTDLQLYLKIIVEWHLDLETSRTWHDDSLWECISDNTGETPSADGSAWLLVLDRSYAKEYRMVFCDEMLYPYGDIITQYPGTVDFRVTPVIMWGSGDISDEVDSWLWKKYLVDSSGSPVEQPEWRKISRDIHITDADMPSAWGRNNPVIFTCTATLPGRDVQIEASMKLG